MNTNNLKRFKDLFNGYDKAFTSVNILKPNEKGKVESRVITEKRKIEDKDFEGHLSGKGYSIGIIPLKEDNTVTFGCIDIDLPIIKNKDVFLDIQQIENILDDKEYGFLIPCLSKSKGIHLYAFVKEPIPAIKMVSFLNKIKKEIGYFGAEVFPKQTTRNSPDMIGNAINLPYYGDTRKYVFEKEEQSIEKFLDNAESMKNLLTEEIIDKYLKEDKKENKNISNYDLIKLSQENLKKLKNFDKIDQKEYTKNIDKNDILQGAPYCLQNLFKNPVSQGSRHDALFNLGLFLKFKYVEYFEDLFDKIAENDQFFDYPTLPYSEINQIKKDIIKENGKDYFYSCNSSISSLCNKQECKNCPFGLGFYEKKDKRKQKIEEDIAEYVGENGFHDLEIRRTEDKTTGVYSFYYKNEYIKDILYTDILKWDKISPIITLQCLEVVMLNGKDSWSNILNVLLNELKEHNRIETVSNNMSLKGTIEEYFSRFLNDVYFDNIRSVEVDRRLDGKFFDEKGKCVYVSAEDFEEYLRKNKIQGPAKIKWLDWIKKKYNAEIVVASPSISSSNTLKSKLLKIPVTDEDLAYAITRTDKFDLIKNLDVLPSEGMKHSVIIKNEKENEIYREIILQGEGKEERGPIEQSALDWNHERRELNYADDCRRGAEFGFQKERVEKKEEEIEEINKKLREITDIVPSKNETKEEEIKRLRKEKEIVKQFLKKGIELSKDTPAEIAQIVLDENQRLMRGKFKRNIYGEYEFFYEDPNIQKINEDQKLELWRLQVKENAERKYEQIERQKYYTDKYMDRTKKYMTDPDIVEKYGPYIYKVCDDLLGNDPVIPLTEEKDIGPDGKELKENELPWWREIRGGEMFFCRRMACGKLLVYDSIEGLGNPIPEEFTWNYWVKHKREDYLKWRRAKRELERRQFEKDYNNSEKYKTFDDFEKAEAIKNEEKEQKMWNEIRERGKRNEKIKELELIEIEEKNRKDKELQAKKEIEDKEIEKIIKKQNKDYEDTIKEGEKLFKEDKKIIDDKLEEEIQKLKDKEINEDMINYLKERSKLDIEEKWDETTGKKYAAKKEHNDKKEEKC